MLDPILTTLAENKEWGVIVLLIGAAFVLVQYMLKTASRLMDNRDKNNSEREERLIRVMIQLGDSIPLLASAIKELRAWLAERFDDISDDLDEIKDSQKAVGEQVQNHEKRIGRLEEERGGGEAKPKKRR